MSKPVLLDLFCGAGGATKGYQRAGFYVVGVDLSSQPNYCGDEFVEGDAFEFLRLRGSEFDVIHASPKCQKHSSISRVHGVQDKHEDQIEGIRPLLLHSDRPWVIENVEGAPLISPVLLCGSMFGLGCVCRDGQHRQLRRHRLFESSAMLLTATCDHVGEPIGVYGNGGGQAKTTRSGGKNRGYMGTQPDRRKAMGIDWMTNKELSQAIPPAYTYFIGRQLLAVLT